MLAPGRKRSGARCTSKAQNSIARSCWVSLCLTLSCTTSGTSPFANLYATGEPDTTVDDPFLDLVTAELGTLTMGAGETANLAVEAPGGASSLLLVVPAPEGVQLSVATIEEPGGRLLLGEPAEMGPKGLDVVRVEPSDVVLTVLLPMTPELSLTGGQYRIGVSSNADEAVAIEPTLVAKTGPVPKGGTIDLVHCFVSTTETNAESAPEDEDFVRLLGGLESAMADSGLRLRHSYEDIESERLSTVDGVEGFDSELAELLSLAPDGRVVHLLYVDALTDGGSALRARTGGTPGPATIGETGASGVAVSLAELGVDPEGVGLAAAHELLHFLGLVHTTEGCAELIPDVCETAGGDPIADTPLCEAEQDTDLNGVLSASECGRRGGDNVRFWEPAAGASALTEGQRYVLLRGSLVR